MLTPFEKKATVALAIQIKRYEDSNPEVGMGTFSYLIVREALTRLDLVADDAESADMISQLQAEFE